MAAKHNTLIFAVISILFWGGLEVSGYANLPLAIALWVIAGLLFLWWLWHSLPEKPFQRKSWEHRCCRDDEAGRMCECKDCAIERDTLAVNTEVKALRELVAERDRLVSRLEEVLRGTGLRNSDLAARAEAVEAHVAELAGALDDMFSSWRYIRQQHGDLPGVDWDRAENKACAALAATPAQALERESNS